MSRFVKISPGVISVLCGDEHLTDKAKVYSYNDWPEEDVKDLIERGFLIEVDEKENEPELVEAMAEKPIETSSVNPLDNIDLGQKNRKK